MPSEKDGKDKHIGNGVYKRTWLHTLGYCNIKSELEIYKAVIDRPIGYKKTYYQLHLNNSIGSI